MWCLIKHYNDDFNNNRHLITSETTHHFQEKVLFGFETILKVPLLKFQSLKFHSLKFHLPRVELERADKERGDEQRLFYRTDYSSIVSQNTKSRHLSLEAGPRCPIFRGGVSQSKCVLIGLGRFDHSQSFNHCLPLHSDLFHPFPLHLSSRGFTRLFPTKTTIKPIHLRKTVCNLHKVLMWRSVRSRVV